MDFKYTDGKDKDFIYLCDLLDENIMERVGEEVQSPYKQFNTLDSIHDVIVAYDNEIAVGCGSFKIYDENTAEIKRVFIKNEYRGKGISKQLLGRLEEQAKEQGFTKLILETDPILAEAVSLYHKSGFYVIENYGQYKCMKDSICMEKVL